MNDKTRYQLDDQTREYLEVALNCVVSVADAQIDDVSHQGLIVIAETLADTFGIPRYQAEVHNTEDGEEVIYRPPSDLFKDPDQDDTE